MQLFLVIFIILHVCWQFSDTEFVVALLLYRLFSLQAAHIRYKINEHTCMHSDAELIVQGETVSLLNLQQESQSVESSTKSETPATQRP